jgi:hypothetical protein
MTDIIDALKRLERVGSEHSKTTEKLMSADRELSAKIVGQYNVRNETIEIVSVYKDKESRWAALGSLDQQVELHLLPTERMRYWIREGDLFNPDREEYVSSNRESALAFSRDVAAGLLDLIEQSLATRHEENMTALGVLDNALKK